MKYSGETEIMINAEVEFVPIFRNNLILLTLPPVGSSDYRNILFAIVL